VADVPGDLAGDPRGAGLRGGFDWASLAVVGLGGTVLIVHESFGFKIVMDELMLAGTSMSMHFTGRSSRRSAAATSRARS
jgi:hypothetical protein